MSDAFGIGVLCPKRVYCEDRILTEIIKVCRSVGEVVVDSGFEELEG